MPITGDEDAAGEECGNSEETEDVTGVVEPAAAAALTVGKLRWSSVAARLTDKPPVLSEKVNFDSM